MAEAPLLTLVRRVRRLASRTATPDGDADLLARYSTLRDAEAFEAIVRRHGPMVWNLCRRMLRHDQDAEDAFQATFLVLARKAAAVGRTGTLAGWLYRVAFRIALRVRAREAGRRPEPLSAEPPCHAPPMAETELAELRSVIDEEIDRLPERFRIPFVLCCLEGRSNSEAAAMLGCPRGTVDSRLSTARQRLRDRLTRRGVTLALAASLETQLTADATAASAARVAATVRAALQFTTAGAAKTLGRSAALANGAIQAMNVSRRTWLAVTAMTVGLFGSGAGVATFQAFAGGEPTQETPGGEAPMAAAEPVRPVADTRPALDDPRVVLRRAINIEKAVDNAPLRDVLEFLSDKYELTIRIDNAEFVRMGLDKGSMIADQPVRLEKSAGITLGDVLREVLSHVSVPVTVAEGNPKGPSSWPVTYRVRGNIITIVPAYRLPYANGVSLLEPELVEEQIKGPSVSADFTQKELRQALRDLAWASGANIVLDVRCQDKADFHVTASLNEVRLFTAIRLLADMAELKPVFMDDVYYVTSVGNADRIEKEQQQERKPPAAGKSETTGNAAAPATAKPASETPNRK